MLGVWFDANFSFADRVCNMCKHYFIQMCNLRWVRQYLMNETALLAAKTLVSCLLDYCNSIFRGGYSFNVCKLQCIQKTLSRIVTNCNKYSQVSPILRQLHRLPVEFHYIFKCHLLTLCHHSATCASV